MRLFSAARHAGVLVAVALFATACDRADAAAGADSTITRVTATGVATPDSAADAALIALADRGRLLGPEQAMWVIMISDYQCPYCKQWHDSSMAAVKRDYIDTGKIRMAYLHLPLPMHPHARASAEAAMCAGAQSKFWEYSEGLFAQYAPITKMGDVGPMLDRLARDQSLNMTAFAQCRRSNAIKSLVDNDIRQASQAGVQSTPSFLIGDFLVQGALPLPDFRRALDTALLVAAKKRTP